MTDERFDLKQFLAEWPYCPEEDVRIQQLGDGREVLQVRLPLGVEQYELEGRPDGLRPHGMESVLSFQESRFAKQQTKGRGLRLGENECAELFEEGLIYYYRYLRLFQIQDWARTIRDTARNLALFDFVHEHAMREEDRMYLEQWRPYLVRVNAVAKSMSALEKGNHRGALKLVERARRCIEELPELDLPAFQYERDRSLSELHEISEQIEQSRPLSRLERLQRDLARAVANEEYERAADLRDRIRKLQAGPKTADGRVDS